jgi:hypothetical protein
MLERHLAAGRNRNTMERSHQPFISASADSIGLYKVCALLEQDDLDSPFLIKLPDGGRASEPAPFWLRLVELNNLIEAVCLFEDVLVFYDSFNHYESTSGTKATFSFIDKLQAEGAIRQAFGYQPDGQLTPESRPLADAIDRFRSSPELARERYVSWAAAYARGKASATDIRTQWYSFSIYIAAEEEFGVAHWPSASRSERYQRSLVLPMVRLTNDLSAILREFQAQELAEKRKRLALAGIDLPLPPLLAILLHRANRREDFWYELLDLRDSFKGFRDRVRELASMAGSQVSDEEVEKRRLQLSADIARLFGFPAQSGHRKIQPSVLFGDLAELAASGLDPVTKGGIAVARKNLASASIDAIRSVLSKRRMRVFYDLRNEFRRLRPAQMGILLRKHWGRDIQSADSTAISKWLAEQDATVKRKILM